MRVKNISSYRLRQKSTQPKSFYLLSWMRSLLLSAIPTLIVVMPVKAAERIYFTYGPLNLSLNVNSLEKFAKTGNINKELEFYMRGVKPEQQEQFRQALLQRSELNPITLYRFFNTDIGEDILTGLGDLITIQGGRNGKFAIRGALYTAATSPDGLTLLNFLRKFPTNIQLNTEEIFLVAEKLQGAVNLTAEMSKRIGNLSQKSAKRENPVNYETLPDLRQPGPFGVQQQILTLTDEKRDRQLKVYLYIPQRWQRQKARVIIFSHGLASRPEDFSRRAEHLASYGYVVAAPQHPGSDLTRLQEMFDGLYRNIFSVDEFINRPLDISFVIDELERRNQSEFEGKLNLQEVGVYGHSFGGYTALAVAGAQIDFENLTKECVGTDWDPNLSLLLQCRALDLPRRAYNFRDERVKAIMAVNPVNSSIFGARGLSKIKIPVLIGAGSYDPATPAIFEQIRSFPWLTTPDKYLVLSEGQAHVDFSVLDAGITQAINSLPNLTLPNPALIDNYDNAMSLAFFEVHLTNNTKYRPYLRSSYANYLSSKEPFKIYLVNASASKPIDRAFDEIVLNK